MQTNSFGNKLVLFLLNPFISAIASLKNIRDGVSHKFLYLWFLVFGIGFCAMSESQDSFRYLEQFMIESRYSFSQYIAEIREYLTFESNIKDIYTLTVNFLVGQFTHNYHWTFFIYSIVFGYFYIKSLKIFLKHQKVTNNIIFYVLLFIFCYSNPIYNINGVRFWTSAWIGVYVALNIFVEKDYKKTPLLVLMPFIHGSSVIWIAILGITFLLRRFQMVVIVLYIASSFVSAVSYLNILGDYSYLLPQFMQRQIWAYTESDMGLMRLEGISSYGAAYADFLNALPGYFRLFLCILLILNRKKINHDKNAGTLLTVMLALSAITNFLSGIPSVGRFCSMVVPFLVIVWASNYNILKRYDKFFTVVPLLYAYSLLYWVRHIAEITEPYLYILPAPLTAIYYLFII